MIYGISDTHFYHSKIIEYENRPFSTVTDMNEHIVLNWNKTIKKDDIVYHLGDFGLCSKPVLIELLKRLNGRIRLILGNHDNFSYKFYAGLFDRVYDKSIYTGGVLLSHKPIECDILNIHGHIHSKRELMYKNGINISVECINYTPVPIDIYFTNKKYQTTQG